MEGAFGCHRFTIANRCCPFREHGASLPARRFTISMEPRHGHTDRRNRRLQCERQGYSDRPPRREEVWRRVSLSARAYRRCNCPLHDSLNLSHSNKPLKLLTKGDNNLADDTELYAKGQAYLDRSTDIIGSVVGYVPFVGYVTILLSEHPWLKTTLLGLMGVMVVLQRE